MGRVNDASQRREDKRNPTPANLGDTGAFGSEKRLTVTVLGKTGSGKTVFLSSLYSLLAEGVRGFGFSATASNDRTDRVLGGYLEKFYLQSEPPEGTKENEITYAFSLIFEGEPVAEIDIFDYRGGALEEDADEDAGAILSKRIGASDIVIWMIDLSEASGELRSRRGRLVTKVRRLQAVCSQAMRKEPRLRTWCFVRSKVDIDFPELSEIDLNAATTQLEEHLEDVVTISTFNNVPYASMVSIAPIGKAKIDGDKVVPGDEAINTEWPLLIPIRMLIEVRLDQLARQIETPKPQSTGINFFGSSSNDLTDEARLEAIAALEKERDFLMKIIERIQQQVPNSVKVLGVDNDAEPQKR
jgi:hypothetical protein